jgi:hypothetical protein
MAFKGVATSCPEVSTMSDCLSKHWVMCKRDSVTQLHSKSQIQKEIMTKGPVTSNMLVFKDLLDYQSGIYS